MKTNQILEAALEYKEHGISCIPTRAGSKLPAVNEWTSLQNNPQTVEEVERLFATHGGNIAFIAGTPSENLACLDVEDKGLFEEFSQEFALQYGPTWTVKSRRGGHILFRTVDTVKTQKYSAKGYEILGQDHYHMAPPSTFKEGERVYDYEFTNRPDKIAIVEKKTFFPLEFVSLDNGKITQPVARSINHNLDLEFCLAEIEKIALNKSRFIDQITGRIDRSRLDFSIILTLTNKGAPPECIEEALAQTRHNTHYRRLYCQRYNGHTKAQQNFDRSYKNAVELGDSEEFKNNARMAIELSNAIKSKVWYGGTALSDRDALLAHVKKFDQCRKRGWDLDVRTGAELAEMSKWTFNTSTKRLVLNDYLILLKAADKFKMQSARYDFSRECLEMLQKQTHTHEKGSISMCKEMQLEDQETYGVFERKGGLGKAAKEVWQAIRIGPSNRKKISQTTGRHPSTVSRVVKRLIDNHIAEEKGGLIYVVPNFDFKLLGEDLGTINIHTNRKRQHDFEREARKEYLSIKRNQWKNSEPAKS